MVEPRTVANQELFNCTFKHLRVRSRQGRNQSIMISSMSIMKPRNFPIIGLNNYSKKLKKQKGPLSLRSELESIDEDEPSEKGHLKEKIIDAPINKRIS